MHYVLYGIDGAALARAALLAQPDGQDRLDAIEQAVSACEDDAQAGWPERSCLAAAAPSLDLTAPALCGAVRTIAVARVVERGGSLAVAARRVLFAYTCDPRPGGGMEIRASDLDGDGVDEITAIFEVTLLDSDDLSNEEGRIGYVLDARDLHTQYRASREWYAVEGDVGGTSTSGELVWRVLPADASGRRALHVRAHGTDAVQDDETGSSDASTFDAHTECPYDAATDAWTCPAGAVRDYFFGDPRQRRGSGWVAETPEQLRAMP